MTTQTILHSYRSEAITLADAIAACQAHLEGAIALLYTPQSCQFVRLDSGEFKDAQNNSIQDWHSIFEARVFNSTHELRWLNREDGTGDAALVTEQEAAINGFLPLPSIQSEALDQQYLLWGEAVEQSADNWQRLAEARIGKLDIPLNQPLKKTQRVYLKTREYLNVGDYGNVAIVEERLLKLEAK